MTEDDRTEARIVQRQREDRARALPLFGILLLASPVLDALVGVGTVLGIPATYFYIFTVWGALILVTARLSRRLTDSDD